MRLALSRIQAAGHNVKHLFLDEGFVACDASNLQKTAGMLGEILGEILGKILGEILEYGGYRSMILMSHLDTVRDAAHVRIGLRRSADDRSSDPKGQALNGVKQCSNANQNFVFIFARFLSIERVDFFEMYSAFILILRLYFFILFAVFNRFDRTLQ